jgi:hypothetical protein
VTTGNRLERMGQAAFILMCVAVTGAAGVHMFARGTASAAKTPPPPIEAGRRLKLPAGATAEGTAAALVLMLSTNCRFCTASMPFYTRLAALPAVRNGRLRLSVISLQPPALMNEYLTKHGLAVSAVFGVPEAGIPVQGTPTLVLTDARGTVADSWFGALPPDAEEHVVNAINKVVR